MRTKEQWLEGIYKMKGNLFLGGEKIGITSQYDIDARRKMV